jgi:hypothetical protein
MILFFLTVLMSKSLKIEGLKNLKSETPGRVTGGFLCLYVVKSDHESPIFF